MDIASLPEEILREIFLFLPFKDLLRCSLICVHWHRIAEPLIYRRACIRIGLDMVGTDQTLWDGARKYHTVIVDNPPCSRRSLVNLLMLPCMVIFKPKEIQLRNFVEESLHKFCRHGHRLFEKAETVCVELNDTRHNYAHEAVEEFIFSFPTVKHLVWDQYSLTDGRNTLVVDAPLLQTAVIEDSMNANTSVLHIIGCNQLQHVKCTLRSKFFENIFCCSFQHLHTLRLDIRYRNRNIGLPEDLPSLSWLELTVFGDLSFDVLETVFTYSKLMGLKIALNDSEPKNNCINLNLMFNRLPELESIELSGLCLDLYNIADAHHLKLLKMKHIDLANPVVSFNAPKLEVLSICEANIINVSFTNNGNQLKKLYVELSSPSWEAVIEARLLYPFIEMYDSIVELTLVCSNNSIQCERSFFEQYPMDVDRLQLHKFQISCDFIESVHHWRHLKRLTLSDCCVVCNCKMGACTKLTNGFEGTLTRSSDGLEVVVRKSHVGKNTNKNPFGKNFINPL